MRELVIWLRAEIERDKKLAETATPGPWRWADWSATFGTMERIRTTLESTTGRDRFPSIAERECEAERVLHLEDWIDEDDPQSMANGEHIMRHHPKDVIARCESELKLLDLYAEVEEYDKEYAEPEYAYGRANGLGEAVRLLAKGYKNRPGYLPEKEPAEKVVGELIITQTFPPVHEYSVTVKRADQTIKVSEVFLERILESKADSGVRPVVELDDKGLLRINAQNGTWVYRIVKADLYQRSYYAELVETLPAD